MHAIEKTMKMKTSYLKDIPEDLHKILLKMSKIKSQTLSKTILELVIEGLKSEKYRKIVEAMEEFKE